VRKILNSKPVMFAVSVGIGLLYGIGFNSVSLGVIAFASPWIAYFLIKWGENADL